MNKLIFISLVLFCAAQLNLSAQDYTFDDGLIPVNWSGQKSYFEIDTSNKLHLNAPAGTSSADLTWAALNTNNIVWEFYFKYDFAASTANYMSIYLFSEEEKFSSSTNKAYYLKLGGIAGAGDKIELIYQNGSLKTTILESQAGIVGANSVSMRVRLSRTGNGKWELFINKLGGSNFEKEASGEHASINEFLYSGIRCVYSSTRRNKIYLDDIKIYEPFTLINYSIEDERKIIFTFSKSIKTSSELVLNLRVEQSFIVSVEDNTIELDFSENILSNTYVGSMHDVKSIDGDTLWNNHFQIVKEPSYYVGQLRFTEWMSDPDPRHGLPEIEWIELLNTSLTAIDLSAFSLSDPSTTTKFLPYILPPNNVVVVCASGGCKQLNIENCLELASMPSLNNSSDSLFLRSKDSILVDYVHYELAALPNDYRRDGGYSIIREVLPQDCIFSQQLNFSSEAIGGTPGFTNSTAKSTVVTMQKTITCLNESQIELSMPISGKFQQSYFEPSTLIKSIQTSPIEFSTSATISLKTPIEEGSSITIRLDSMQTCLHKTIYVGENIEIIHPKPIESKDIFINEILYNAYTGGVDFIELFNTTNKYIQLKNTHYLNTTSGKTTQHFTLTDDLVIPPVGYTVLSGDKLKLKQQYSNTVLENCIQNSGFLSFSDDGGEVIFLNEKSDTLDRIKYGDQFQNPLNRDDEGISLEKIKPDSPVFTSANWTSCAVGATPGYLNSQSLNQETVSSKIFYCSPCHVTTNLNGNADYVHLHLNPKVQGAFASVSVYTLSGELIDKVCVNQLLGSLNTFNWYGQQQASVALPDGIYIAVAEWWSPNGNTHTEKIAISTSQY